MTAINIPNNTVVSVPTRTDLAILLDFLEKTNMFLPDNFDVVPMLWRRYKKTACIEISTPNLAIGDRMFYVGTGYKILTLDRFMKLYDSEKPKERSYDITAHITGYMECAVHAESKNEAREKANRVIEETDFGGLTNIDWDITEIEEN